MEGNYSLAHSPQAVSYGDILLNHLDLFKSQDFQTSALAVVCKSISLKIRLYIKKSAVNCL